MMRAQMDVPPVEQSLQPQVLAQMAYESWQREASLRLQVLQLQAELATYRAQDKACS